MVPWGIIIFFGILPVAGWGPICTENLQFPISFIIMTVFQAILAFLIVITTKTETSLHVPSASSAVVSQLYRSKAYQNFKDEIKNDKSSSHSKTKDQDQESEKESKE